MSMARPSRIPPPTYQRSRNAGTSIWRWRIFSGVVAISFILLAARIYVVQFIERGQYVQQADENRLDTISIPATRGVITDRYGKQLAANVASANVTVTPAGLPDDPDAELAVLEKLSSLINVPVTGGVTVDEQGLPQRSLLTQVREGQGIAPFRPVIVKKDIPIDRARIILAQKTQLPGVGIEFVSAREYPTGPLTSQIIGYMGPIPARLGADYEARGYVLDRDRIGYDGVEFTLEDLLAGQPGLQTVVRDVAGEIVQKIGDPRPATPGYNVELTIDAELQQAAQDALTDEIKRLNTFYNKTVTERGVVIAMNPRTGEVLAMVSWPTYDNSRFARNIDYPYYLQVSQDPLKPLFNQAVGSLYPPGSIFKILTLTAVLEEGVVRQDDVLFDPGHIELVNRYYPNDPGQSQRFVCWIERGSGKGHGYVDARHAIAWSCDVYFYKVGGGFEQEVPGLGLGIERLAAWMDMFGLAKPTGVELPGDQNISQVAVLPTPDWKRRAWGENWSTGDTYNSAFGQGYVTVTPMQILNVLNTIVDDGNVARPTLVRRVLDSEGHVLRDFIPDTHDIRDLLRAYWPSSPFHPGVAYPETLSQSMQVVRDGMREAVTIEGGTALGANLGYVPVAGKTGTAEYCDDNAAALDLCVPGNWPAHAWFMEYAPFANPEISIVAFVYNGNEGAIVALPVATQVMDAYFKLKAKRAAEQQAQPVTPTPPLIEPGPGAGPTPTAPLALPTAPPYQP